MKRATEVQDEKDNLEHKLGDMTRRWTELKGMSRERKKRLDEAVEATTKYQELKNQFVPWLDETEKSLEEIKPSCDVEKLKEQEEKLKVFTQCVPYFPSLWWSVNDDLVLLL